MVKELWCPRCRSYEVSTKPCDDAECECHCRSCGYDWWVDE